MFFKWSMPQMQDGSLHLLACSSVYYLCVRAASSHQHPKHTHTHTHLTHTHTPPLRHSSPTTTTPPPKKCQTEMWYFRYSCIWLDENRLKMKLRSPAVCSKVATISPKLNSKTQQTRQVTDLFIIILSYKVYNVPNSNLKQDGKKFSFFILL